ncbi:MAG TPA: MMPL family transporter [Xanthomonadaceae bacterium]|nr:MMPL family transporter [Xanthomonadaceae bacterium]
MNEQRTTRASHWPAWLWAAMVLALCLQQMNFWRHTRPDTDVIALLPGVKQDAMLAAANQRIVEGATQQVVVLIGSPDFERAKSTAEVFLKSVPVRLLKPVTADETGDAALDFYAPHRGSLLTSEQRNQLAHADIAALANAALARLYGPGLAGGLTDWRTDPLGLWPAWWQARLGKGMQSRDGWISVDGNGLEWVLLRFTTDPRTFRLDGNSGIQSALDAASAQARLADPKVKILEAGVPLHAEAAAARGNWEMNTIGFGSLLAVLVLVWLAFRSLRPILLVSLTLLIGTVAGVAATTMAFGKIHVLTLVFGASLVGVAEDFGILYFAARQAYPETGTRPLLRHLMPGLFLALATSVLAYLALGFAPLPGLQQMAVFSAAGLLAAFLTVVCWFPWLDRSAPRRSAFSRRIADSLASWPRWRLTGTAGIAASLIAVAVIGGGLCKLQVHDDLRYLLNSPTALLQQEREVGGLLGLPSPAQFYLVSGASAEEVLRREEQLKQRLDSFVAKGVLTGYAAVSDWVPSASRQRADAQLSASVESAVVQKVATVMGETVAPVSTSTTPLELDAWLKSPVSGPLRKLWLGNVDGQQGSLVMLQGLSAHTDLLAMQALTSGLPGVRWIDRTLEISRLLARYRQMMTLMLLAGYVLVAAALVWRFKREAWRALMPTVLAALLSQALLGWLGEPLQLFTVLAHFLLLGVGVDYGIFLIEYRDDPAMWLAVALGAAGTVLSFGLLALSATPALHTFGLTMLFGVTFAWLLSPCFRPANNQADPATAISPNSGLAHAD